MNTVSVLDIRAFIDTRRLSRPQWRLVALCFLIVAIDGMDVAIMGFVAPSILTAWHLSQAAFGFVMGAAPIGLAAGALVAGSSSDWLGRRHVLLGSLLAFGIFTLLTAYTGDPVRMALMRLLTGLGLGAAMPNASTLVTEYVPQRSRSLIVATMFTGFTLGSALIGFVASYLIPRHGWQSVLLFGGALPLALVPALLLYLPESARLMAVRGASAESIAKVLGRVTGTDLAHVRQFQVRESVPAARQPLSVLFSAGYSLRTLTLWVSYFMGLLVVYLSTSWMPTMIRDAGFPITLAARVTALFQLGGTVGAILVGVAMDRFSPNRAIAAAYAAGALCLLGLGIAGVSSAWLGVLVAAVGFFVSGAQTGLNAYAPACYPTVARATGTSWMLGIGRLGSILGSSIGGLLLVQGWGFTLIFVILAIPATIAALAMLPNVSSAS
jgi:AAHS family 4-hydroxybenzoate transporter-like MFS transporter